MENNTNQVNHNQGGIPSMGITKMPYTLEELSQYSEEERIKILKYKVKTNDPICTKFSADKHGHPVRWSREYEGDRWVVADTPLEEKIEKIKIFLTVVGVLAFMAFMAYNYLSGGYY